MTIDVKTTGAVAADDAMADAFDQAFDFVRGAIEDPDMLDRLPDKATLALRGLTIHGHPIQLAAAREVGSSTWTARISRWAPTTESRLFLRPVLDDRGVLHDQQAMMETFWETRETREAALDALEHRLRAAIDDAVRFDPDRPER